MNTSEEKELKEEIIGLNTLYQTRYKKIDEGLNKGQKQATLLDTRGYAEAELSLKDPTVFSAWYLCVGNTLIKKPVAKAIESGKKKDIAKSKKLADFYNFCFDKIEKENTNGIKQLFQDILINVHLGTCYIEKIYETVKEEGKYKDFVYNPRFKAKKNGLWDFVFDEKDNIIGFKSLLSISSKVFPKNKFISIPFMMTFNNPNGNGRFEQIWKYFDAKREYFVFMLEKGARLVKDKQLFVKAKEGIIQNNANEHKDLLQKIKNHLVVFIPAGYDLQAENFDSKTLTDFLGIFRELDSQIVKAYLGSSTIINESTTGAGNYNTAENNKTNMSLFQKDCDDMVLQVLKSQIIKDLFELNYDYSTYPEEIHPKVFLEYDKEEDISKELEKDTILIDKGILDLDTDEDLQYLRTKYKLPENESLLPEKEAKNEEANNNKKVENSDNTDNADNTDGQFYE